MQRRGPRISRAYQEPDGYRCVVYDGKGARSSVKAPTEAAAIEAAQATLAEVLAGALTIAEVIDAYRQYLLEKGDKLVTADLVKRHLIKFFAPDLTQPIADLTAARAEELYRSFCVTLTERSRPPAVATQQTHLADASALLRWCCASKRRHHPGPSPFDEIEPVGRRHKGKPQPRLDEAREWLAVALDMGAEWPGAIAAAVALLMGLRAGEIVSRTARDLDDGGRLLWVTGKTNEECEPRQVEVPEVLQEPLRQLAQRHQLGPLFGFRGEKMVTWWTRKAWEEMNERRGKVGLDPIPMPAKEWRLLSAHSLRGLHATLAAQSGITAHVVAGALGHGVAMLRGNYAQPGALETGASKRAALRLVK